MEHKRKFKGISKIENKLVLRQRLHYTYSKSGGNWPKWSQNEGLRFKF